MVVLPAFSTNAASWLYGISNARQRQMTVSRVGERRPRSSRLMEVRSKFAASLSRSWDIRRPRRSSATTSPKAMLWLRGLLCLAQRPDLLPKVRILVLQTIVVCGQESSARLTAASVGV